MTFILGDFSTRIPEGDSHNHAVLDLLVSSDPSIYSTVAFPPLENSDHVVALVSIDLLSKLKRSTTFHRIGFDYFCADWDGLREIPLHLRDISWEHILNSVFLQLLLNFVSGSRL